MVHIEDYRYIADELKTIDVAMLFLNAGVGSGGPLKDEATDNVEKVLTVNLLHYIYLCRMMLPQLLERAKKTGKRCAIVSTSSVSSMVPIANKITYGGTKSFV